MPHLTADNISGGTAWKASIAEKRGSLLVPNKLVQKKKETLQNFKPDRTNVSSYSQLCSQPVPPAPW
jgi:hypothetical protein